MPLVKSHRRVRFAAHDKVFEIRHLKDMSDEEISSVYTSSEELQAIQTECRTLVRMMDEGQHIGKDGKELFCARGIDQHTQFHTSRARDVRSSMYNSIYTAQCFHEQEYEGSVPLEKLIGALCQRISSVSVELAHAIGMTDAKAVRHLHHRRHQRHSKMSIESEESNMNSSRYRKKKDKTSSNDSRRKKDRSHKSSIKSSTTSLPTLKESNERSGRYSSRRARIPTSLLQLNVSTGGRG